MPILGSDLSQRKECATRGGRPRLRGRPGACGGGSSRSEVPPPFAHILRWLGALAPPGGLSLEQCFGGIAQGGFARVEGFGRMEDLGGVWRARMCSQSTAKAWSWLLYGCETLHCPIHRLHESTQCACSLGICAPPVGDELSTRCHKIVHSTSSCWTPS